MSLEGGRTALGERRVPAPLVIEHFDVVEQLHLGVAMAAELIGELALDRREEDLMTALKPLTKQYRRADADDGAGGAPYSSGGPP